MPSEFDLIDRFFTRPVSRARLGVGDDCALVAPEPGMEFAITTDMLLAGRHFLASDGPGSIGHKALAVNLSDLAAMGATPRYALLAIALPEADEKWLSGFAGGFFGLAQKHGVEVIGGDTTRGNLLTLAVTAIGVVPQGLALRRDGAKAGDDIWVSGTVGDAALALAHLRERIALEHLEAAAVLPRLMVPTPRVILGERLRGLATACIDVSDGFCADLGHVLESSGLGAEVEFARLPCSPTVAAHREHPVARDGILGGGDDYELLFTAAKEKRKEVESIGFECGVMVSRVGRIVREPGLRVIDAKGNPMVVADAGYDHFRT